MYWPAYTFNERCLNSTAARRNSESSKTIRESQMTDFPLVGHGYHMGAEVEIDSKGRVLLPANVRREVRGRRFSLNVKRNEYCSSRCLIPRVSEENTDVF